MNKIAFKGTGNERVVYANPNVASSITRSLEARGYVVHQGGTVSNPWLDGAGADEMIAVKGRLAKADSKMLFLLAASEETANAVWEAIHLYYPDALSEPVEKLTRPV